MLFLHFLSMTCTSFRWWNPGMPAGAVQAGSWGELALWPSGVSVPLIMNSPRAGRASGDSGGAARDGTQVSGNWSEVFPELGMMNFR